MNARARVPTWKIAADLGRGVKAVEKYRSSLMRRLDLSSTAAVARFAVRCNLLRLGCHARKLHLALHDKENPAVLGEIARRLEEDAGFAIDPDSEHAALAARHLGLGRTGDPHDDVVAAAARDGLLVALDRAEQHQIGPDEARVDLHLMGGERDDELFGAVRS